MHGSAKKKANYRKVTTPEDDLLTFGTAALNEADDVVKGHFSVKGQEKIHRSRPPAWLFRR